MRNGFWTSSPAAITASQRKLQNRLQVDAVVGETESEDEDHGQGEIPIRRQAEHDCGKERENDRHEETTRCRPTRQVLNPDGAR